MKETFHVSVSTEGRQTTAEDPGEVRRLVKALVRPSRGNLVLFDAVDDHVHTVVQTDRPGIFGRDLVRTMKGALPGLEFQPAFVRPVKSRKHYERLVSYLLEQPQKHRLPISPALWEGSCFLDLAGARLLEGFDRTAIGRALPRLRFRDVMRHVGLQPEPIVLAPDEELRRMGPARIADLAASVYLVAPGLAGRTRDVSSARALVVRTCLEVGYSMRAIVPYLGVSARAARRAAVRDEDPKAATALRRRVTIERLEREQRAQRPWPGRGRRPA